MDLLPIPGYRALFGEPNQTYEQLLSTLPSEYAITLAIILNNELQAPLAEEKNQIRLKNMMFNRFHPKQRTYLEESYKQINMISKGAFNNFFFAKRYLLEMIVREVERNCTVELTGDFKKEEYNFYIAYLLIIDEANNKDFLLMEEISKLPKDEFTDYRKIWTPLINQYQFNENSALPYEMFKLISFLNYSKINFRSYLKEYLNKIGINSIGMLLNSFYQVISSTFSYNPNEFLTKYNYIKPTPGIDERHLQAQCLNSVMGTKVSVSIIKSFPLFFREQRGYLVIDTNFYFKKLYRGVFFELLNTTSLKTEMDFSTYSSKISKDVLEINCFRTVIEKFRKNKHELLVFDELSNNCTCDAYFRNKNTIFLIEFKGNLFPDKIPEYPNFEIIINHIDERFVKNKGGKQKESPN